MLTDAAVENIHLPIPIAGKLCAPDVHLAGLPGLAITRSPDNTLSQLAWAVACASAAAAA